MFIVNVDGVSYGHSSFFGIIHALQTKGWHLCPPALNEFVLITRSRKYYAVLFFTSTPGHFKRINQLHEAD